jgi:hypothetical protein
MGTRVPDSWVECVGGKIRDIARERGHCAALRASKRLPEHRTLEKNGRDRRIVDGYPCYMQARSRRIINVPTRPTW